MYAKKICWVRSREDWLCGFRHFDESRNTLVYADRAKNISNKVRAATPWSMQTEPRASQTRWEPQHPGLCRQSQEQLKQGESRNTMVYADRAKNISYKVRAATPWSMQTEPRTYHTRWEPQHPGLCRQSQEHLKQGESRNTMVYADRAKNISNKARAATPWSMQTEPRTYHTRWELQHPGLTRQSQEHLKQGETSP